MDNFKKTEFMTARKLFFQTIVDNILLEPTKMDKILGQDIYYIKPDKENIFLDENRGDLSIPIEVNLYNIKFTLYYTVWQVGKQIAIGINFPLDFEPSLHGNTFQELRQFWGENTPPKIDSNHKGVFYEWRFIADNLYQSYADQEKYILGIRHMHFRLMRALDHLLTIVRAKMDNIKLEKGIENEPLISEILEDIEKTFTDSNEDNINIIQ